jgi:hypothetical protein
MSIGNPEVARIPRVIAHLDATDVHFHFRSRPADQQEALLRKVYKNYGEFMKILKDPDMYFGNDTKVYPPGDPLLGAWAHAPIGGFYNGKKEPKVWFRGIFANVAGRKCRVAMIVHECAHAAANARHYANDWPKPNGAPDKPDGISVHPRNYMNLTAEEAATNACTYAAFAANARFNDDCRPGAHDLSI